MTGSWVGGAAGVDAEGNRLRRRVGPLSMTPAT
jgi:hypothetical protein